MSSAASRLGQLGAAPPVLLPEYALAAERYFGPEQGAAWVRQAGGMLKDWARVAVTPKVAKVIDFETRWPSAIAKAMAAQG